MKVIVCLDDKNGMMFNRRRQSRDRAVCARIAALTAGRVLRMAPCSAGLFGEELPDVRVGDDFLEASGPGEFCFVENAPLAPWAERIETLIVFRWNRVYPADVRLDLALDGAWHLARTEEFPGHSHEKITMEVYER